MVRIEATGPSGHGSGFLVRVDGNVAYVATASHVVEGDPAPRVFFRSRPHSPVPASVVQLEGGDPDGFAVLRLDSGVPSGLQPLAMAAGGGSNLRERTPVEALGIPADIGNWAPLPGSVISWKNRKILFSGGVDEGNSGGPLLAGEAVVGMVMRATRFGEAVPAFSLRIFLRNNGVHWREAPGGRAVEGPSPPVPIGPKAGPKEGESFRDCDICPEMVVIPAGSFRMGSPEGEPGRSEDEGPVRTVSFARPFAMARNEVSFEEWDACVRDGGCDHEPEDQGWGRGRRPVINVSWKDAQAYVQWLSRKTGEDYRLPSEAEWEYAARAGTQTPFFTGDCISTDQANYDGNFDYAGCGAKTGVYRGKTLPVGSLAINGWGLFDVLGNVWEWTEDCWNNSYRGAPSDGSAWNQGDCSGRVSRGGSWSGVPGVVRSAIRGGDVTEFRGSGVGFRPARTL